MSQKNEEPKNRKEKDKYTRRSSYQAPTQLQPPNQSMKKVTPVITESGPMVLLTENGCQVPRFSETTVPYVFQQHQGMKIRINNKVIISKTIHILKREKTLQSLCHNK